MGKEKNYKPGHSYRGSYSTQRIPPIYILGLFIAAISSILVIGWQILNWEYLEKSVNFWLMCSFGSIVILSAMLIATIVVGFSEPEVWEQFLKILGACVIGPIAVIAAFIVVAILGALIWLFTLGQLGEFYNDYANWGIKTSYIVVNGALLLQCCMLLLASDD